MRFQIKFAKQVSQTLWHTNNLKCVGRDPMNKHILNIVKIKLKNTCSKYVMYYTGVW